MKGSSRLRETVHSNNPAVPDDTALFLIRDAVAKRGGLIYGTLHADGMSCAIGTLWDDNPELTLHGSLIDEVAAVNDADPNETPRQRHHRVLAWLRWKVRVLAGDTRARPPAPKLKLVV